MKIKKAFDICKKAKTIILYRNRLGDVQMLSDGAAVYPLDNLPELDEEYICQIYDINDKQREKIRFMIDEPLPEGYMFDDVDPAETETQIMDFSIKMDGCGVLLPIFTESGIKFINTIYLTPFSDTDSGDIHITMRRTKSGLEYFALKVGMLLYAIILPVDIINKPFVDKLKKLYDYSKLVLEERL